MSKIYSITSEQFSWILLLWKRLNISSSVLDMCVLIINIIYLWHFAFQARAKLKSISLKLRACTSAVTALQVQHTSFMKTDLFIYLLTSDFMIYQNLVLTGNHFHLLKQWGFLGNFCMHILIICCSICLLQPRAEIHLKFCFN